MPLSSARCQTFLHGIMGRDASEMGARGGISPQQPVPQRAMVCLARGVLLDPGTAGRFQICEDLSRNCSQPIGEAGVGSQDSQSGWHPDQGNISQMHPAFYALCTAASAGALCSGQTYVVTFLQKQYLQEKRQRSSGLKQDFRGISLQQERLSRRH